MNTNKVQLKEGNAVPIVITEKIVRQAPKTIRRTSYLGIKAGLNNLYYKLKGNLATMIHDAFYDESIEVLDPGIINETHYVIQVGSDGYEPQLTVERAPYKPPCATHYEIIKIREGEPEPKDEDSLDLEAAVGNTSRPKPRRVYRQQIDDLEDI